MRATTPAANTNAAARGDRVGLDAPVGDAPVDVGVQVDQAGRDDLAFDVARVLAGEAIADRRDLLLREPLDLGYHYVMDVEWFLRCGRRLHAVLCDCVFGRFRISSQGKTSEYIRSGAISAAHAEERERYRTRHIYPRWPGLAPEQARRKLERRQVIGRLHYYWLKLRYAPRYVADRWRRN